MALIAVTDVSGASLTAASPQSAPSPDIYIILG